MRGVVHKVVAFGEYVCHILKESRPKTSNSSLIDVFLQMGVEPWLTILLRRPIALLNLMCTHPTLYEMFSRVSNLWILLLEEIIRRETSTAYAKSYVFQMSQFHTLFEDDDDDIEVTGLQLCIERLPLTHFEHILYMSLNDDLFDDNEDYYYTSIITLYYEIEMRPPLGHAILLPYAASNPSNVRRPRLMLVYGRLLRLLRMIYNDYRFLRLTFDHFALYEYRFFDSLVAPLGSIDIKSIDEYTCCVSCGPVTVMSSLDDGNRLRHLIKEVYRLVANVPNEASCDMDLGVHRELIFGSHGLYHTREKQHNLFLSELRALVRRRRVGKKNTRKALQIAKNTVIHDYA